MTIKIIHRSERKGWAGPASEGCEGWDDDNNNN
jgi:hypothetical protein